MSKNSSHSSPSPNSTSEPRGIATNPSPISSSNSMGSGSGPTTTTLRAASQPHHPTVGIPSPIAPSPRSPWSPSQSQSRYLSPTRTSGSGSIGVGIPTPQTRSSSFSGSGGTPQSFSSAAAAGGGGGGSYFSPSRFGSTFEDDESGEDPVFGTGASGAVEDDDDDDVDVDAMIGRLRPSGGDPYEHDYDEYSDSPVYTRRGVGMGIGGGRLPPSLSSSLSPSQLPGEHISTIGSVLLSPAGFTVFAEGIFGFLLKTRCYFLFFFALILFVHELTPLESQAHIHYWPPLHAQPLLASQLLILFLPFILIPLIRLVKETTFVVEHTLILMDMVLMSTHTRTRTRIIRIY